MKNQNAGFTLLEVVIALCLFSIGLMGISVLSAGLIKGNMASNQRTVAVQLARNKMEALISMEYSDVEDSLEKLLNASETIGLGIYNREVTVNEFNDPNFKNVTVAVTWTSAGEHREAIYCSIAAP